MPLTKNTFITWCTDWNEDTYIYDHVRHLEPAFTVCWLEHEKFKEKDFFFKIKISLNYLFVYTVE